jgi:N-methylhydantoinase A
VPPNPGNVSAFGLQVSDVRRDYVRTLVRAETTVDPDEVEAAWRALEARATADLAREGVPAEATQLRRTADARYEGEASEVNVRVPPGLRGATALEHVWEAFLGEHVRIYGFGYRGQQQVEIVNLRLQAVGAVYHPPEQAAGGDGELRDAAPASRREVWLDEGWRDVPVYQRASLRPGDRLADPAIVEEYGSTIVVFPGWGARVDGRGNIVMERKA